MIKKIFFLILLIVLGLFVFSNIYSSQFFPPLLFTLVNQQKRSDAILFLKKIKKTKEFPQQLNYYKNIYGQEIEKEVFAEELKRKEEIKKLKMLLKKNQKARDVLVKLAILYFEEEDFKKAKEYYQKAKEVDPQIKIEELEKILTSI